MFTWFILQYPGQKRQYILLQSAAQSLPHFSAKVKEKD